MVVKVGRAQSGRKTYIVQDGATVGDALNKAGIVLESTDEIFVNAERASKETVLHPNANVTISSMIKGN